MKKIFALFLYSSLLFLIITPAFSVNQNDELFYEDDYELEDEFIYDNMFFDLENADQLEANRVSDEIIIKFVDFSDVPGKEKQLQNEIDKVKKIGFIETLDAYVIQVEDLARNPNAIFNRFKNNRFVQYIEPNYLFDYSFTPNDQYYSSNQAAMLTALNAQNGWAITKGENSPVIAIIDSGVASHSDLPVPVKGYSAISSLAFNNDKVGHGTSVAGTAGAIGNNKIGGTGINMHAKIMAVKVDDTLGSLTVANIAKGITWAADNGAKVISISLVTASDSATLKTAIDYAYKKGCAIFAASGNDSKNSVSYPARYSNVMAVGASSNGTSRATWSNYGPELDVVSIGTYFTTTAAGGYAASSGTSFATPQVAGLASLIYSLLPDASNEEVYPMIRQNTKPLGGGYNRETGYGLIDIGKTLKVASAMSTPVTKPVYSTPPVITLKSFTEITIFVGDTYQEMGYTAVDCFGVDITRDVQVTGTINTSKAGIYVLSYTVTDNGGNTAKATRTITVENKPVEQPKIPTISVIGSNPIILHIDSGTPYIEQGAKAIDADGSDISRYVDIIGEPDRYTAGSHTVTYSVIGKDGGVATTTRDIIVIAPASEVAVRTPYNFNEQAKQGARIMYTGIVAGNTGWLDLSIPSIDKNMIILVQLVNSANKAMAFTEAFSAAGSKQYKVNQGKYDLIVNVDRSSGNSKFAVNLLTPEVITREFDEIEVPY